MQEQEHFPEEVPAISGMLLYFVLCIAALGTEAFTIGAFWNALSAKSWPTAEGTITHSELTESFVGSTQYKANISYSFEVNGQLFKSTNVRTRGTSTKYQSDAAAVIERFPEGSQVVVHYKQGDPSESLLEVGVDFINFLIIIIPLVFAFFFGAVFIEKVRQRRMQAPEHLHELAHTFGFDSEVISTKHAKERKLL